MSSPRPSPLLSNVSIRWIAPVLFVLPVIAVTLALTIIAMRQGREASTDLAQQNVKQIHARIIERLDYLLRGPVAMNETYEDLFEEGLLEWNELAEARPAVYRLLRAFPSVSSTVLGAETGQSLSIIRYPGEDFYEMAITEAGTQRERVWPLNEDGEPVGEANAGLQASTYDPRLRPWYIAAEKAGKAIWSPVYVWVRNGEPATLGLSYVQPFYPPGDPHQFKGVIDCEITLADISEFLTQIHVGATGRAFIMDRQGHLLASSGDNVQFFDGTQLISAADADDSLIAESAAHLHEHFANLKNLREHEIELFTTSTGRRCHLEVSPYHYGPGLDWLVITVIPDADFLAHLQATRDRAIMLGAAAAVLAVALGLLLALILVQPVLQLARQVRLIGDGHLDEEVNVSAGREMTQLSNALNRMIDAMKDRMRLRHSLDLAMEVQQSLLPADVPELENVDIAAHSTYCDETGGDYYDFVQVTEIDDRHTALVVGDVMGHGIAAAMFMATARGVLRSRTRSPGSLAELLDHTNDLLVEDTQGKRFMTMLLMMIDGPGRGFRWAAAGHDPPFVYEPDRQAFRELQDVGGLPLGIMRDGPYQEGVERDLTPDTVILLGTDGLWEAQNPDGEQYGKERIRQVIREHADQSAAQIVNAVLASHQDFTSGREEDDDVTFMVAKFV